MRVLSLFPGAGLLDFGFELAGISVLRGPDLLFNRDIRDFDATPWAGTIDGVIGGVPCQLFSTCVKNVNKGKHFNLWPEFWRVVRETGAQWTLGECVEGAEEAATSMFDIGAYPVTWRKLRCDKLGSNQMRPRLFVAGGSIADRLWSVVDANGYDYGHSWREKINRNAYHLIPKITGDGTLQNRQGYACVCGDGMMQKSTGIYKSLYITGDDLLDAFDLPKDWDFNGPGYLHLNRNQKARLITQGVPVAAAYSLAMCIRDVLEVRCEATA